MMSQSNYAEDQRKAHEVDNSDVIGDGVVLDRCPGCGAIKLAQDALCSACFVAEYKECAKESYDINEQKLALEQEKDRLIGDIVRVTADRDALKGEVDALMNEIERYAEERKALISRIRRMERVIAIAAMALERE